MKMGLVISTNDSETVWNAFRLANFSLTKKESVKVFLLGKAVEAEQIGTDKFDVVKQMETFTAAGGKIFACGTCLQIRNAGSSDICRVSTMAELYEIISEADKVLTF
jgi:uncharacterized protein involved in oxidation of intracellular sulfur